MSDARSRLPLGSKLDESYIVVEYLDDYDTDTMLVYKMCKEIDQDPHGIFTDTFVDIDEEQAAEDDELTYQYFIISEYYPITGCLRNADNSLSIDEKLMDKQQFDNGRADFFKAYLKMHKPEGEQPFGIPVDYKMINETAYCIFDYNAHDYRQKLQSVLTYATLPTEYLPPYQEWPGISYEVDNDVLTIKGIDFNSDAYYYLLRGGVESFVRYLHEGVERERDSLYSMLTRLDEFETSDSDCSMGERETPLSVDEMDEELGKADSEWRILRFLIKPEDKFYSWIILGECSGVAMSRNGRTFKSWVTTIS